MAGYLPSFSPYKEFASAGQEGFPVAVERGYFEVGNEKADDIFQRDAAAGNVSFVVERECLIGQYEAEMQVGDFTVECGDSGSQWNAKSSCLVSSSSIS
jgi:hypothetical protein